jgi:glycosyltransferase involved in cell wall biosynthesis
VDKQADIIVPVRNEQDNLPILWARLTAMSDFPAWNIIFIDNASTDNSVAFIETIPDATLIRHDRDRGYGASLRNGMAAAKTGKLVIIDADCEYPPESIPMLLEQLDSYPVVYASRLFGKSTARQAGMPMIKWLGNRLISSAYNRLFAQQTTDLYTGCKAMRRECLKNTRLQRNGFEHVLELAVQLAALGYAIKEIPIDFKPRSAGQSKMSHASEITKFFLLLLRYKLEFICGILLPSQKGGVR